MKDDSCAVPSDVAHMVRVTGFCQNAQVHMQASTGISS
jgi:hypothetical protein